MKKALSFLLITVLLFALVGCNKAKEKDFEKSGMKITLITDFAEKEHISYTAIYESTTSAVYALKEDFSNVILSNLNSLDEYAELVILANMLEDCEIEHKDDLTYFQYEKTVNGKDFSYLAFVYEGSDAYWLIQFACEQKNASKFEADFFKYAKSVTVE